MLEDTTKLAGEETGDEEAELEQEAPPPSKPPSPAPTSPRTSQQSKRSSLSESSKNKRDPLNTEFIYYSSILRTLAPALSSEIDRCRTIPWIKKLFGPEYQPGKFREKRNKYLCSLAITLMNDEVSGVFHNPPPCGALYNIENLACEKFETAEWERDGSWEDTILGLPEDYFDTSCTIHQDGKCDEPNEVTQQMLDEEFQLFLHLLRPYAALLPFNEDRLKIASWIQLLCSVTKDACLGMRSLRNDYMHSLYGSVHDLCLLIPFNEYAPSPPLPLPMDLCSGRPLDQLFTDPTSDEANEFLKTQPMPENGAFCYIAVSGELTGSSLGDEFPVVEASSKMSTSKGPQVVDSRRHVEVRTSRMEVTSTVCQRPCESKRR